MAALDLAGITENIQSILQSQNSSGASDPGDLSSGLAVRVAKIKKLNPSQVAIQGPEFPLVSVYIAGYDTEPLSIGPNRQQTKRKAVVDVKIFAAVFDPLVSDNDEDQAYENVILLMANIENILRTHTQLPNTTTGGTNLVDWSKATGVEFFDETIDENSVQGAEMSLEAHLFY